MNLTEGDKQFYLYNDKGSLIDFFTTFAMSQNQYSKTNLPEGNYYLYINENTSGACQTPVNIYVSGPLIYSIKQTNYGCIGGPCTNKAQITFTNGLPQNIAWNGIFTNNPISPPLCPGWNRINFMLLTPSGPCNILDSVLILNLPFSNPSFLYSKPSYCSSDSFAIINNFPATAGGTFSILQSNIGIATIDQSTGIINIKNVTSSGEIIIKYTIAPPCTGIFIDTIMVSQNPAVSDLPNQSICPGEQIPVYFNNTSNLFKWYFDLGLTSLDTIQLPGESFDPFRGVLPISGTYFYYVTTLSSGSAGCESIPQKITISIDENGPCGLVIYNGITPNGDNHNDFWQIDGIANDPSNTVSVFNRWGDKIWETVGYDNLTNSWEGKNLLGKDVTDATYFYVIKYKNSTFKGWVELTR